MAQAPRSPTITCTPAEVVANYPCLQCLSDSQLMTLLAMMFYALNNDGDYDVNTMIEEAKCFTCLTDHQKLQALASITLTLAVANGYFDDAEDAVQAAVCLGCADPNVIKSIIVNQYCVYMNALMPN